MDVRKTAAFIFLLLSFLVKSPDSYAQCNWTQIYYESYEYTSVIPYLITGTTYQNTPQTYTGCVRTGTYGLYMNFVNGYSGLVYSQPFTDLCPGQNYRFSFSTRDAFTSSNNLTINIKNASGTVILSQNVINGSTWNDITMSSFTAPTSTITFEIVTNTVGGAGNDAGFDDLRLWQCQPVPQNYTFLGCNGGGAINAYNQISNPVLSTTGVWTGPSILTNGYLGTFTPGTNINGTYTYTIDGATGCTDSVAIVSINYISIPTLDPISNVSACQSYILPSITGTNLTGTQSYYTGSNGTGTAIAAGTVLTSSQTLYAYDGTTGCSDQQQFTVTISTPNNAGPDNGAYYCGSGIAVNMATFLSSGASTNGTWTETTLPVSGHLNSSGIFNTNGLSAGTYTFNYTVPANGACSGDIAAFTIVIGNLPSIDLGQDTTLCTGQTITLNAASNGAYDTYLWNNNSTSATRFVTSAGTYSVKAGKLGSNQIVNGDFENGNTGFTTDYIIGTGGTWGPVSNPGTYLITTSPNLAHTNFSSCTDHTAAPGVNMMVVNGAGTPGTNVWCQSVPVQANTTYQFGTWVANALNDPNVAQLQFQINNSTIGSIFSPTSTACNWQQFTANWNSGINTTAQICILNQNTSNGGNDFVIDDITFKPICYSYDTIVVSYSAYPVVNLGSDTSICEGNTIVLDAQNSGSTFLWTGGSTNQSLSVDSSGTYQVTVTNPAHCSSSDQIQIFVEQLKNAGGDSSAIWCSTAGTVNLTSLLTSSASLNGLWYDTTQTLGSALQTNGDLSISSALTGQYQAIYVVYGTYCPNDTSLFDLLINEQPVAANDAFTHVCNTSGDEVDMNPYTIGSISTLAPYWQETSTTSSHQFDSVNGILDISLLSNGNYTFDYVLPADTMCVNDTMQVIVEITENPIIQFSSDVVSGCFPLTVNFLNESYANPGSIVEWDLGDGTISSNSPTVQHTYTGITCFDVTLTITTDNLCTVSGTKTSMICVDPLPVADFTVSPQQTFSDDPTIEFSNNSLLNTYNEWLFGDGTTSGETNPSHQYPLGQIGNYEATLIVTTDAGCTDTTSKYIIVKDQLLIYVPNAFTPDGDEFNNTFSPVLTAGFDPTTYHLRIYDRWGELIFESYDINVGWDGTYNGKIAKEGTFSWFIQFKDDDNDGMYKFKGHVTLIR